MRAEILFSPSVLGMIVSDSAEWQACFSTSVTARHDSMIVWQSISSSSKAKTQPASFINNTSLSCQARYWFSVSRGEASMCRHLCGWDQPVRPLTLTLTVPSAFAAPETTTHLIPGKAWRCNLLLFSSFTSSLSAALPAVPTSRCLSSEAVFWTVSRGNACMENVPVCGFSVIALIYVSPPPAVQVLILQWEHWEWMTVAPRWLQLSAAEAGLQAQRGSQLLLLLHFTHESSFFFLCLDRALSEL